MREKMIGGVGMAIGALSMFSLGGLAVCAAKASLADWLSFAGSILGASITILGAVLVFEWQVGKERREREQILRQELEGIVSLTHGYHCADEPALRRRTGQTVAQLTVELRRAISRVREFHTWMEPHSVGMLRAFDEIEAMKNSYDELEVGTRWRHVEGADLGGLNFTGHDIEARASDALKYLKSS